MRKLLFIVVLTLLVLGGSVGLLAIGLRLAWEEVPPPPETRGLGADFWGRASGSVHRIEAVTTAQENLAGGPTALDASWAACRSPPACSLGA